MAGAQTEIIDYDSDRIYNAWDLGILGPLLSHRVP